MNRCTGNPVGVAKKCGAALIALSIMLSAQDAAAQEKDAPAEAASEAPAADATQETLGEAPDPAYDPGILNTVGDTSTSMPLGEEQAEAEAADPALTKQLSPAEQRSVEEIVVSARKRSELLVIVRPGGSHRRSVP